MEEAEWQRLYRRWWLYRILAIIPGLWWGTTICLLVASDSRFHWRYELIWCDIFIALPFIAIAIAPFISVRYIRLAGYGLNLLIPTIALPVAPIIILFHQLRGGDFWSVVVATVVSILLLWPAWREYPIELALQDGLRPNAARLSAADEMETEPGWDQADKPTRN